MKNPSLEKPTAELLAGIIISLPESIRSAVNAAAFLEAAGHPAMTSEMLQIVGRFWGINDALRGCLESGGWALRRVSPGVELLMPLSQGLHDTVATFGEGAGDSVRAAEAEAAARPLGGNERKRGSVRKNENIR